MRRRNPWLSSVLMLPLALVAQAYYQARDWLRNHLTPHD